MTGTGTLTDPYDLTTALTGVYMVAGTTVHLRAGTYTVSDLTTLLTGKSGTPTIIRAYVDPVTGVTEDVIIDGGLLPSVGYLRFMDIRFTNTNWSNRESLELGGSPTDLTLYKSVYAAGAGIEFINCILDNGQNGVGWYGNGGSMYGCLVFHNGWKNPGVAQGHGLYLQNNTPRKTVQRCIIFDNFGWGVHAYASDANKTNNITLDGNIMFNNGSCYPAFTPNFSITNTVSAEVAPIVTNNTTHQPTGETTQDAIGNTGATDVIYENNYHDEHCETSGVVNFLSNTGNYDGPDVGNRVMIYDNAYDPNRLHLEIRNQAEANSVSVDVSSYFADGITLTVKNVQDYFSDHQSLVVSGGAIQVDMQAANRSVASPVAWTAPATSFPQYGAFVITR